MEASPPKSRLIMPNKMEFCVAPSARIPQPKNCTRPTASPSKVPSAAPDAKKLKASKGEPARSRGSTNQQARKGRY